MRLAHVLSIGFIVGLGMAIASWESARESTSVLIGYLVVGIAVPELVVLAVKRVRARRDRRRIVPRR